MLAGAPGANRDIGVLNAAAALMVIGRVDDLAAGVELADESIDSGRAEAALESAGRDVAGRLGRVGRLSALTGCRYLALRRPG